MVADGIIPDPTTHARVHRQVSDTTQKRSFKYGQTLAPRPYVYGWPVPRRSFADSWQSAGPTMFFSDVIRIVPTNGTEPK